MDRTMKIFTNYTKLCILLMTISLLVTLQVNSVNAQQVVINGAGASFPSPLIDTWRTEYQNVDPETTVNYASIGSGGGIKQFTGKTVDFGATDAPLSASEFQQAGNPVHIPETIGSVVLAYNIPDVNVPLNLTGEVVADIFLGNITTWNDQRIQELNPGVTLPSENINIFHRADGSGTTFVFTDYLSKVSDEWEEQIGTGKSVQWPTGIGGQGNEGVTSLIAESPYSIGYIELAYALATDTDYAAVKNQEGNFILPTVNSTVAAVVAAISAAGATLPSGNETWENVSITNPTGAESYPISSFSYLLLPQDFSENPSMTEEKAQKLVEFIRWAINEGQQFAEPLGYVPLPEEVVYLNQGTLDSLTFAGNPISTSTNSTS
jgi:phosphate transport system substrate-binding protein